MEKLATVGSGGSKPYCDQPSHMRQFILEKIQRFLHVCKAPNKRFMTVNYAHVTIAATHTLLITTAASQER